LDGRDNANSYFNTGGRLGIGTSAPANIVHAHSASSNSSTIQLTNNTTGVGAGDGMQIVTSDSEMQIRNRENGVLNFWTNNTKAVTIDTSQRVGTSMALRPGLVVKAHQTVLGSALQTQVTALGSSPTERMRIDNLGRIFTYNANTGNNSLTVASAAAAGTAVATFIGVYSATGVNTGTSSFIVWTNGNVQNTNNSYTAISDIKLKENIVDANSQWDDLKALRVAQEDPYPNRVCRPRS
jgi:hypothetical protein